eukprot:4787778-Prymnesium_polylepis.1
MCAGASSSSLVVVPFALAVPVACALTTLKPPQSMTETPRRTHRHGPTENRAVVRLVKSCVAWRAAAARTRISLVNPHRPQTHMPQTRHFRALSSWRGSRPRVPPGPKGPQREGPHTRVTGYTTP